MLVRPSTYGDIPATLAVRAFPYFLISQNEINAFPEN